MDNSYYKATHSVFQGMIGMSYHPPVVTIWLYSNICNCANDAGYELVVMLHDGVVYKNQPQQP